MKRVKFIKMDTSKKGLRLLGKVPMRTLKQINSDLANKGGVTNELGIFGSDPASNLQLLILELTGATR